MDATSQTLLLEFYEKIKIFSPDEIADDQRYKLIVEGILDRTSAVACKALRVVHSIIVSGQLVDELVEAARNLMYDIKEIDNHELARPSQNNEVPEENGQREEDLVIGESGEAVGAPTPIMEEDQSTTNPLLNILLARCEDEKVNPRKHAISAVEAFFLHFKDQEFVEACLEKLEARCRDQALTVRKQAAESLTRLLQNAPGIELIELAWLNSVMNLIVDRETGVQQFCSRLISEVIITPIIQDNATDVTWRLLYSIEQQTGLKRLLLRCLVFQHKEHNFPNRLVKILELKTKDSDHANAAWMLLGELSAFLEVDPSNAANLWIERLNLNSAPCIIGYLAKILANRARFLKAEQKVLLKEKIAEALSLYRINALHISAAYFAFAKICDGIGEDAPGQFILSQFNKTWFYNSLHELDSTIYNDTSMNEHGNENNQGTQYSAKFSSLGGATAENANREKCEKLVRIISSIGECVQYTPSLINKQVFKILKVIIASDVLKGISDHSVGPTPMPFSPARSLNEQPDTQSTYQGGDAERASSIFVMKIENRILRAELLTRTVRAHAVLTLGKLCLQDEKLAKKCIPVFIRQLKINNDHFVRNNVVVAVCDLCIRYTLLVDRYSTILAACLKDCSVLVRHQTLMLLTNLIKEQYLKWEGSIIYRFVTAVLDPEKCIRKYAEFCLVDILLVQYPSMFFNHFMECLFYFNDVKHQSWKSPEDDDELSIEVNQKCSLEGDEKFVARMHLYKFMLKTFSDDKKFSVCARISEIFASVVDGTLSLEDNKVVNLLRDSFKIMCSQDIKFSLQPGKRSVDDEADEDEPEAVKTAAKSLISSVFRKALIEAIMPNLIVLKEFLVEKRSHQLLNGCLAVISDLFKNYPEQIDDFLMSSPQLKAELEFDLKQLQTLL